MIAYCTMPVQTYTCRRQYNNTSKFRTLFTSRRPMITHSGPTAASRDDISPTLILLCELMGMAIYRERVLCRSAT